MLAWVELQKIDLANISLMLVQSIQQRPEYTVRRVFCSNLPVSSHVAYKDNLKNVLCGEKWS